MVETVTTVAQEPEEMLDVPSAVVPEAKVVVTVPDEGNVAVELIPVPPFVLASRPDTWVARFTTVVAARQKIEHPSIHANIHRRMA